MPVVHEFGEMKVTLDGIIRRGDTDSSVIIPGSVIRKRRKVSLKIDDMREVVDLCLERKGLMKLKVNAEEALQPVCFTDEQS